MNGTRIKLTNGWYFRWPKIDSYFKGENYGLIWDQSSNQALEHSLDAQRWNTKGKLPPDLITSLCLNNLSSILFSILIANKNWSRTAKVDFPRKAAERSWAYRAS